MSLTLFKNFPIISYNGQNVIDLTQNINVVADIVANQAALTPYVINQTIRSDQLARQIYGDAYMDWLIFMTNGMVNPYNWHMDQNQFYNYIDTKYGDYIETQQKIAYYINNWYSGGPLTVSAFDALSPNLVKYYEPQYDAGMNIVQYNRKQIDWVVSTNHLVQYCFNTEVPIFIDNEIVNITYNQFANCIGQVCFSSNNQLNIQHVIGAYIPPNSINSNPVNLTSEDGSSSIISEDGLSQVYWDVGLVTANLISSSTSSLVSENGNLIISEDDTSQIYLDFITNPISSTFSIIGSESNSIIILGSETELNSINIYDTLAPDEDIYYDTVTIFDDENMKNEANKFILYLSNNYTQQISKELSSAF